MYLDHLSSITHQLNCPACDDKLSFSSSSNSCGHLLEVICGKCKHKYRLEQAEVTAFNSKVESLYSDAHDTKPTTKYRRSYQLRLLSANKTAKSVQFYTLGQEEKLIALPGDNLMFLYTMHGKKQGDLIWLKNQANNQSHLLQRPGSKARSRGTATRLLTLAASTAIATVLHIPLDKLFVVIATPSAISVGVAVTRGSSIKVRDRSELSRLEAEQQLLLQKLLNME